MSEIVTREEALMRLSEAIVAQGIAFAALVAQLAEGGQLDVSALASLILDPAIPAMNERELSERHAIVASLQEMGRTHRSADIGLTVIDGGRSD